MSTDTDTTGSIVTDAIIIGAGPCGLFQVFELGLLDIKAHVIESLPGPGGQCAELYPSKPIYDIPAYPVIGAQELIDRLLDQIAPFEPTFHYSQQVTEIKRLEDDRFFVTTSANSTFITRSIIVAGGVGSFAPVPLKIPGVVSYPNDSIYYSVKDPSIHYGKDIVILGGGDSALDWALELYKDANSVVLIHRSDRFKASPASVKQMHQLCDEHQMQLLTGNVTGIVSQDDKLKFIEVTGQDGVTRRVELDQLLVFYGLSPKLGPISQWGLDLKKNQIIVDTEKFQSNEPGIYAVGDINWYPGKKKLILSGFHEAALAAFAIKEQLNPGKKVHLQYTTTSPAMHKKLGVPDPYANDDVEAA